MPFGEELYRGVGGRTGDTGLKYSSNQDDIRQKFTGYQKDNETGLDFAEARMYENRLGRFTAVDPFLASGKSAKPQSFNRYVYVLNNPFFYTDENGKWPTEVHREMIHAAFADLTYDQREQIAYGSNLVDTYFGTGKIYDIPITLFVSEAYKHAMIPDGMSYEEAYAKGYGFATDQAAKARSELGESDDFVMDSLSEFGKGTHIYSDSTSPAHGPWGTYAIPKKLILVPRLKVTTPNFLRTATLGDLPDCPFVCMEIEHEYRVVNDWQKFAKEMLEHHQKEKTPTQEQHAEAIMRMRAYFLTTYGDKRFARAVKDKNERQKVYDWMTERGITWQQ